MPHCTYSFRLATVVRTSCVGKINRGIAPWGGQDYERLEQALKIVSETDGGRSVKRNPRGDRAESRPLAGRITSALSKPT